MDAEKCTWCAPLLKIHRHKHSPRETQAPPDLGSELDAVGEAVWRLAVAISFSLAACQGRASWGDDACMRIGKFYGAQ